MQAIEVQAAAWLAQLSDDAMDWDGFTQWLEADPRHRGVFDELTLIDADLDARADAIAGRLPASDEPAKTAWQRWSGWGAGAVAASIAVAIGLQFAPVSVPEQTFVAPAGVVRTVTLPDGVTATLAPGSTIAARGATLALYGTAFFDIEHRVDRTLTIRTRDFEVHDIGTRFTVGSENGQVEIAVASGSLTVSSAKLTQSITLVGGRAMVADEASGTVRLSAVDPAWVGSWRNGKLHFDNAPLAMVARDISRYSGTKVIVDPAVAGRPFSGVIAIDDKQSPARALADIMDLELRPVSGAVRIQPRGRR